MSAQPKRGHKRTHKLVLTVVFDEPCTVTRAAKLASDCLWGEFASGFNDGDPQTMNVKSIVRLVRR